MNTLRIYLFGGFALEYDGAPVPTMPSLAARSLFAYLITFREREHTRALLAGLLWPELPEATARRRLSHALWEIGRTLAAIPESYLRIGHTNVGFNREAAYWLDTERFERALTAYERGEATLSTVRTAVERYRGDFLAGFYDDWILLERERLRDRYLDTLALLIQEYKAQGRYDDALTQATALVRQDTLREDAHREVMRLCFLLGRPLEALQQYERCHTVLSDELGVAPSPATTTLYEEIRARSREEPPRSPPSRTTPASPLLTGEDAGAVPFVGRDVERARLVHAVEQTLGGAGGVVLVEGEPGVGKTRLLQQLDDDAAWRGIEVLWGHSRDIDEVSPYGALRTAFDNLSPLRTRQLVESVDHVWLREVAGLVPALRAWLPDLPPGASLPLEQEQRHLLEAITQVFLALEQIAPHVVIFDDLQWADEGTLTLLDYLAPRVSRHRLLLVVSYQSEDVRSRERVWQTIRGLDRTAGSLRLVLHRLNADETAELVRRSLGLAQQAPRFTDRLYRESGGNPLFALVLLHALHDTGALSRNASGTWHTPRDETTSAALELPTAPALRTVIEERLTRLRPESRNALDAAAVLGGDVELEVLLQVCTADDAETLRALDDLLGRGLLVERENAYRFSHDYVRRVTYALLDRSRRHRLHRRAGDILESINTEPVELLAHHFEQGEVWDKAAKYHRRAGGRAVELHAYESALVHYDRAVTLAEVADLATEDRYAVLAARERVLDVLGRREDQADDLDAMHRLVENDPNRLVTVHCRRAWLLAHTNQYEEAEAAARTALSLAERIGDTAGRGAALTALGVALDWRGDTLQAIPYHEAAVECERRRGDLSREARARATLAYALIDVQQFGRAFDELDAALSLYEQLDQPLGQADTLDSLGVVQWQRGNVEEAETRLRRALATCRSVGYVYGEAHAHVDLGNVLLFRGKVGAALAQYETAARICEQIASQRGIAITRANTAEVRHLLLGEDDRAASEAEAALVHLRTVGDEYVEAQCLGILGSIALRRRDLSAARRRLERGLSLARTNEDHWTIAQVLCQPLVMLELADGNPERALEYVEIAEDSCTTFHMPDPGLRLRALKGTVLLALDDADAALAATTDAVASMETPIFRAYLVHFWHAHALEASGHHERATQSLAEAHRNLLDHLDDLTPAQRKHSLIHVPEHRAIVEAWDDVRPHTITVRLPHVDAPLGRPLHDDEWIEITWTTDAPQDRTVRGGKARRQHRIRRLLREAAEQRAAPRVHDLAAVLDVSTKTIKRDLAALREAGCNVSTRGTR